MLAVVKSLGQWVSGFHFYVELVTDMLGRWNREKESKMVVAKRQGRSEDQSENFRQNKQHSWLSPICIGQDQVEKKII